jgi:hypothetical protein
MSNNNNSFKSGLYDNLSGYTIELNKDEQSSSFYDNVWSFISSYIVEKPPKVVQYTCKKISIYHTDDKLTLKVDPDNIITHLINMSDANNVELDVLLNDLNFIGALDIRDKILLRYNLKSMQDLTLESLELLDRYMILSPLMKKGIVDYLSYRSTKEKRIHVSCINEEGYLSIFTLYLKVNQVTLFGIKVKIINKDMWYVPKENIFKNEIGSNDYLRFLKHNLQTYYDKVKLIDKSYYLNELEVVKKNHILFLKKR